MEDLLRLKKELLLASESKDALVARDMILQLSNFPITKELLQASGLGPELGKLSKVGWSALVSSAAKDVMDKWKNALKNPGPVTPKPQAAVVASASTPVESPVEMRKGMSEPEIVKVVTGVRKRDVIIAKFVQAMGAALEEGADAGVTAEALEQKSIELEAELEKLHGRDQHAHKTKFLQLLRNLRDPANSQLRLRVAVGHVPVSDLLRLSAAELASEEVQRQIKDLEEYNKEASKARRPTGEITERFGACGKCKSPKTSYFMMQTRSADEPMTIFITCIVCGHAWRK